MGLSHTHTFRGSDLASTAASFPASPLCQPMAGLQLQAPGERQVCPCVTHSTGLAGTQKHAPAAPVRGWPSPELGLVTAGLRVGIKWPLMGHQQPSAWDQARATEVARSDNIAASTPDVCQGPWMPCYGPGYQRPSWARGNCRQAAPVPVLQSAAVPITIITIVVTVIVSLPQSHQCYLVLLWANLREGVPGPGQKPGRRELSAGSCSTP